MAVSKRTRYEVLKRDNFTCRYCRSAENPLKVDHVTPVALGGGDDPSNLVAACQDCNSGKASTAPDAATVADVAQDALRWAAAITRVARARGRQHKKQAKYAADFWAYWRTWKDYDGDTFPMAANWETTIRRFYDLGVPFEDLMRCADIALGNSKVGYHDRYRYFAGCAWRVVTEIQDAAKALLVADDVEGGA